MAYTGRIIKPKEWEGVQRNRQPSRGLPAMWHTLRTLTGNQRICVWMEPFFGIPFNLFTPLAAVYMAAMGLNPFQIGIVTTVSMLSQMVAAPLGGMVVDYLGRRRTTALFDVIAWVIPPILWATAQGPASFFAAALFNGCWRVTETSWSLLLTDEAPRDKIIHLYGIVGIAGLLAGFLAPLTSLFVEGWGLIPTMRGIYWLMAGSMVIKVTVLYAFSHESPQGRLRMEQSKGMPMLQKIKDSRHTLTRMLLLPRIRVTVGLMSCFAMIKAVNDNFWPLLLTQKLGVGEETLPVLSMVRTMVMLVLFLFLVPHLDARRFRRPLMLAMALVATSGLILFSITQGWLPLLFFCVAMDAVAFSILQPLLPTLNLAAMPEDDRARMLGLATMLCLLLTAPFTTFAGWLSRMDRSLPLFLNVILAATAFWLVNRLHRLQEEETR